MSPLSDRLRKYPALVLLIAVYVISCVVVFGNYVRGKGGAGPERKKVLRIAHWQLEPGICQAVDYAIAEYVKLHPDVEIRQLPIPETGYFQYVNTQLIGGTAPDMIECGLGGSVELWQKFYARYFLPLDQYVDEPNPYNVGTEHEGVPWRKTYFDEMEGGYEETLQSFFRVPLSAFTMRLYYNQDMVSDLYGGAQVGFPTDFDEFVALCKKLEERYTENFVPMSGASYGFERIADVYQTAFTANFHDRLDLDYNGIVSTMEYSGPIYSGRLSMMEPAIKADFGLLQEITSFSPRGATALGRDEADFLFLQGHAAMLPTGSWDYSSLAERAEFQLGVSDIPLPARDNAKYGPYVAGQPTEADTRGAFPFAVTKVSRYPEVAIDFLQFCASRKMNEELNRRMFWLPVVLGAKPRKELEPFTPRIEGYSVGLEYIGPNTKLSYDQMLPLFLLGKDDYDTFARKYTEAYRKDVPSGAQDYIRNIDQTLDEQMRSAALRRAAMNNAPGAADTLTGEPVQQYQRILEAYAQQVSTRRHEVRVWVDNARAYEQSNR